MRLGDQIGIQSQVDVCAAASYHSWEAPHAVFTGTAPAPLLLPCSIPSATAFSGLGCLTVSSAQYNQQWTARQSSSSTRSTQSSRDQHRCRSKLPVSVSASVRSCVVSSGEEHRAMQPAPCSRWRRMADLYNPLLPAMGSTLLSLVTGWICGKGSPRLRRCRRLGGARSRQTWAQRGAVRVHSVCQQKHPGKLRCPSVCDSDMVQVAPGGADLAGMVGRSSEHIKCG
jgi:hypothetical protein